ncbi:MAG: hypothetical protein JO219_00320 [Candidatus Eremiobacteraeota bacterium]|nr:hypothetical protein [Candidatus Eremiobacteraeota bacterium]MBV8366890.1 hypothetical protein [Candidatus Eremiobacteraeota bacterium]
MTIRLRDQAGARPAGHATPAAAAENFDALEPIDGVELDTLGIDARALARDLIQLSARARMLLRAGLAVRALLLDVLAHTYRTITLGTRTIVLEFGIYR